MSDLLTGSASYARLDDEPIYQIGSVFLIEFRTRGLIDQGFTAMEAVRQAVEEFNRDPETLARCGWCKAFHSHLTAGRDPNGFACPLCNYCPAVYT